MAFEKIYPLDAAYDTLNDAPPERCGRTSATRSLATSPSRDWPPACGSDFGERGLDIVVHSLANGPEVRKPLVETSRAGYLAAVGVSAYSNMSLVRHLGR